LLLAVGTVISLALASSAGAASIVTYPLPEYEVQGSKYVNEDIDHMAVATNGTVWWSAFAPGQLGDLVPSQATAGTETGQHVFTTPSNEGNDADGVAVGPEGDIYFGMWNPSALWKLEPAGPTFSKVTSLSNGVPEDLAFSPVNGHLFATIDGASDIAEYFTGVGTPNYYGPISANMFFIKVDSAGNAWTGAESAVDEVPYASGGKVLSYTSPNNNSKIQAVTIDHSGNIWFTDRGDNSIGEIIPSEGAPHITEYPIPEASGGSSEAAPYDITTASDGSIWFTESDTSFGDPANNEIGEINPIHSGSEVLFSMQHTPDGKQPQAITADASGNVWYSAGGGNSSDELGEVKGATTGGTEEKETKGNEEKSSGGTGEDETKGGTTTTTTTTGSSPTTSSAPVETVTTSSGQSITLATAPGEAGYAELDKHLLGGLSGNDIAKLLANGGFSIQIPLTYPAYPGNYSANGTASPEGIPGYDGEGVDGGEVPGSGGDSLAGVARKKTHHLAPVVLFRYQHDYTTGGTYTAKVHFTAAGLKLLRAAARAHRSLKVSVTLSLTAAGHTPINQKLSTTLKAGVHKKSSKH
jgi:streptogramin lyase